MNRPDPIAMWRAEPRQTATSLRGWNVVFAMDSNLVIPALDYIEGKDSQSSSKHPFTRKQVGTLAGYVGMILYEGPRALRTQTQFKVFEGDDTIDGMCELRFRSEEGHRLLCFQRDGRDFVVACGFVKPRQPETPPVQKLRARGILRDHEQRNSARRFRKHEQ